MVDYSKWDRLDLSDSDSDGGEAGAGGVVAPNLPSGAVEVVDAPRVPSDAEVLEQCESLMRSLDDHRQMPFFYELLSRRFGPGVNLGPKQPFVEEWFEAILDAAEASIGSGSNDNHDSPKGVFRYANGDNYEGELKDGKPHGKGICRYADGNVYDGEWKDEKKHGSGTLAFSNGDVYNGEFWNEKRQGRGYYKSAAGDVYDGEWANDIPKGKGTQKWGDGRVYEGEFVEGREHGRGTMTWPSGEVYEGGWARGTQHGKGTIKLPTGENIKGEFKEGMPTSSTLIRSSPSDSARGIHWAPSHSNAGTAVGSSVRGEHCAKENRAGSDVSGKVYHERQIRSQRSQHRRLEALEKVCEHCGVDDGQYKLRVCSGCNLALYCSAACQKAGRRSHRRICSIISELPSRDFDHLALRYDKDKMVDFDAGLRYATKYMANLKHLQIDVKKKCEGDTIKLSAKQLSSLFRTKKGTLETVGWDSANIFGYANEMWKELYGLKHLRIANMECDDALGIQDVLLQQRDTLLVLSLPWLVINWSKANCCRTIAQAVNSCKSLVKLDLRGCCLIDIELKVMLQDLPNLRILDLTRYTKNSHEFADSTCGLIARICPSLQQLSLRNHNHLSVRGIRKIFQGCTRLRSFCTTTCNLSSRDIRKLLGSAPQLMYFSLGGGSAVACGELDKIIEATGGRTFFALDFEEFYNPAFYEASAESVSAATREMYACRRKVFHTVNKQSENPEVVNAWEDYWMARD